MFDGHVHDRNFHDIHALGDTHDPVISANGNDSKRHGFVEGFGGDFHGVLYTVHIFDRDAAGAHGHDGMNLTYSLFLRHKKSPWKNIRERFPGA